MQYVPELLVENLSSFLVMARKFHPTIMEEPWLLWPSLTLIVALMGSPGRVKNPHLRAKLAEVLEALLPWQRGEEQWLLEHQQVVTSRFQRERLFKEHPHRMQVNFNL
jgi:ubiquitin conjugation factor E4 A